MPFKGFTVAPFTPFKKNGEIHPELIPAYIQFLKRNKVSGAFVNGTTGEGLSLTEFERNRMLDAWMLDAPKGFRIINNVGANSIASAKQLAAYSAMLGVDAIAMMLPGFFQPKSVDELVTVCARVAEEAPDCGFYYYHIPSMTKVHLSMLDFVEKSIKQIPNFKGLKYSTPNFFELHQLGQKYGKLYDFFFGCDELLAYGLLAGANGAVGSTYNYMVPLYRKLQRAFEKQQLNQTRKLQNQAIQFVDSLIRHGGGVVAGKTIMSHTSGLDFGPCRLPLKGMKASEKKKWLKELEELGYEKYCSK